MTQTALITGAAKRVGRALALGLAKKGYDIVIHFRSSETEAHSLAEEIRSSGRNASLVQADLGDEAQTSCLVEKAMRASDSSIDVLINNASTFDYDDIHTATRESWDRHMQVNLRAPFVLMQEFERARPQSAYGTIINIIDHRVWKLNPLFTTYTVSKAGLWTLTQTMAQALAPYVRVNAIGPGPVLPSVHQSKETFEKEAQLVPLEKGPLLEEIVRAVSFIIDTPSLTGQMLALDGGQHLSWRTEDVAHGKG